MCEQEPDSVDGVEPEYDEEDSCCCKRSPCGNCMECLGMSWRDFM